MKKILFTSIVIAAFAVATALPTNVKTFNDTYKVKKGSNLAKASCSVCHVSVKGGKLNLYGKDVQAAMKKAKTRKLTAKILKSVEKLDSNKNKIKNIDEIKKDILPGAKIKKDI